MGIFRTSDRDTSASLKGERPTGKTLCGSLCKMMTSKIIFLKMIQGKCKSLYLLLSSSFLIVILFAVLKFDSARLHQTHKLGREEKAQGIMPGRFLAPH